MEKIIPISDLQTKAKRFVDQVRKTDEPIIITQHGRAAAVLVSYETYEGHTITQDEASYPDAKRRLARAQQESRGGKGMPLEAYLKKRLAQKTHKKAA